MLNRLKSNNIAQDNELVHLDWLFIRTIWFDFQERRECRLLRPLLTDPAGVVSTDVSKDTSIK